MREDAALRTSAGAGRVDDAGGILAFTRNKNRLACVAEFLPSLGAGEIGTGRSFRDEHDASSQIPEFRRPS